MFGTGEGFFSTLTGPQRLLAFLFVVAVTAALVAFLAGGLETGIPIGILVLTILWITRPLWKPSGDSKARIYLTSLSVISGVALAVLGKTPEAKLILGRILEILKHQDAPAQSALPSDRLMSALVLIFVLTGVFIVNWLSRDDSAMQKHPEPLDQDFPEQTYRERLKRFSEILLSRLNTLDEETKWDDYFFAPLEAEVQITSGRLLKRKIVNLMTALKGDRTSRIILVIGDPGSGKSIALRKLAKELMKEVDRTGRVPVYINLKEWVVEHQWTEQNPPTVDELRRFILSTLRAQSIFADDFLQQYFDRMVDRGRFFFLLDSFDETPAVLDSTEASWLIQCLSRLIGEFFLSQHAGRGIVTSRFYRRPTFSRGDSATFEIRPFSDLQIREAFLRSGKLRQETIERLFRSRSELIPVARNPFSAALIRIYAENHGGELPSNQLEMYESYIEGRLSASNEKMQEQQLDSNTVMVAATDTAWCMFQAAEIGLEAPVSALAELLPSVPVQSVTTVLRYSGLGRMSGGPNSRFSFVHRRLNEYFVARKFLGDPRSIRLEAIPTDSRYRDALALYCEVGATENVKEIANFCWAQISEAEVKARDATTDERLRAVHCLRFLRDGFRTRPDCIAFVKEFGEHIAGKLQSEPDLLDAKIALEATGLLPESIAEPILVDAFALKNSWISETALHACRHLQRIGGNLERGLLRYLSSISLREFVHRHREISFSLSLSDAFRIPRRYCILRSGDCYLLLISFVLLTFLEPIYMPAVALFAYLAGNVFFWAASQNSKRRVSRLGQLIAPLTSVRFLGQLATPLSFMRFFAASGMIMLVSTLIRVHGKKVASNAFILPFLFTSRMQHGRASNYILAFYLIVAIAVLPLLDFGFVLRSLRWHLLFKLRNFGRFTLLAVAIPASGAIELWVLDRLARWKYVRLLEITGVSIVLLLLILVGAGMVLLLYHDRTLFNNVTKSTAITRRQITSDFQQFRTSWYRLRYVEWVRDGNVQPEGTWPHGRPNVGDEASTLLAQLDERWLGLEG